jgi:hypothetical protein
MFTLTLFLELIIILLCLSTIDASNKQSVTEIAWEETLHKNHKLKFITRTFYGREIEYRTFFETSLKKFHPNIPKEHIIIVLDSDSPRDNEFGIKLSSVWPYPLIKTMNVIKSMRPHEMQQGGYLYADTFVDDEETYIAMIDTDSVFISQLTEETIFDKVNKKPHFIAYVGNPQNTAWYKMPIASAGK